LDHNETMAARVLVVDDEPIVRDVLTRYLSKGGFRVESAEDGQTALERFAAEPPDLVLLDLMLPGPDGIEVFTRIRADHDTPVIMLTARGRETDRVVGLEIGADDYIAKPFSPREVLARVRAVLRRVPAGSGEQREEEPIRFQGGEIDPAARTVTVGGRPVPLTPKEFDLLLFLAGNPGQVFDRLELLAELWDFAFDGDPSTVTVHVRRLREKVERDPSRPRHLVTVWGAGYRFDP
jgi:two-component system, OmpR family, response regulator ResD